MIKSASATYNSEHERLRGRKEGSRTIVTSSSLNSWAEFFQKKCLLPFPSMKELSSDYLRNGLAREKVNLGLTLHPPYIQELSPKLSSDEETHVRIDMGEIRGEWSMGTAPKHGSIIRNF